MLNNIRLKLNKETWSMPQLYSLNLCSCTPPCSSTCNSACASGMWLCQCGCTGPQSGRVAISPFTSITPMFSSLENVLGAMTRGSRFPPLGSTKHYISLLSDCLIDIFGYLMGVFAAKILGFWIWLLCTQMSPSSHGLLCAIPKSLLKGKHKKSF